MKRLKYECDDCEDIEYWDYELRPGFHCECGGHLFLVRTDNFSKMPDFTECMICINKNTDECIDCRVLIIFSLSVPISADILSSNSEF